MQKTTIKDFFPKSPFFLAPMEAVNCTSFRILCKRRGAGLVYTDMIDADVFMNYVNEHSEKEAIDKFLNPHSEELPLAIQLGGANILNLLSTIEILKPFATIFDYNVGCPLPYMLGKKGGVYLMKHPEQLYKIITAMRNNIELPFTVKIRAGWDKDSINAPLVAKEIEKIGVDAITIHPRTRRQKYEDRADWTLVRKIKEEVTSIPIILSGDVTNSYMAHMAFAHTKCDFIMIGRGAKNNPSVFLDLNEYYKEKKQPVKPITTYDKKTSYVKNDWKEFIELYTSVEKRNNLSEIIDHALWLARECQNNKFVTQDILSAKSISDLDTIFGNIRF